MHAWRRRCRYRADVPDSAPAREKLMASAEATAAADGEESFLLAIKRQDAGRQPREAERQRASQDTTIVRQRQVRRVAKQLLQHWR